MKQLESFIVDFFHAKKINSDCDIINSFAECLELGIIDFMTICDLVEIGSCCSDTDFIIVLMVLFALMREGSVCIDLDKDVFSRIFPENLQEKSVRVVENFLSGLKDGKYAKLIAKSCNDYLPLIIDQSGARQLLYFQKYYFYEKNLKGHFFKMLSTQHAQALTENDIEQMLTQIYSDNLVIRVGKKAFPISADKMQQQAIRLVLTSSFSIITGGPGTGKTSLMVNMLRCLVRAGINVSRIILAAPTGRAAQRMTQAVTTCISSILEPTHNDLALCKLKGSTLHKVLQYQGFSNDFYYRDSNKLPASVVVIDEISMVDLIMLEKVLQAIDISKTKLVFLGDKDQLPSVEAGAVFAEMISDKGNTGAFKNRLVVLKKVYRLGENLLKLAENVNQGLFPLKEHLQFKDAVLMKSDKWAFVKAGKVGKLEKDLICWIKYHYFNSDIDKSYCDLVLKAGEMEEKQLLETEQGKSVLRKIFQIVEKARILSFVRKGFFGCEWINILISRYIANNLDPFKESGKVFSGAIVIITRNDYSKELFNGDVGVILQDSNGVYKAFFPCLEGFIRFHVDLLPAWQLSFAMTVHKSQGSEFDDVMIVLPDDENHRLLTKEIVYTAITRAKKKVIIYGAEKIMQTALSRKIKRQSGLIF